MQILWLVPFFPLVSFLILAIFGQYLSRRAVAFTGVIFSLFSCIVAWVITVRFIVSPPENDAYTLILWHWIAIPGFTSDFILRLDPLSIVMVLTVTIVSFLILLYSAEYMESDEGYARFFSYMNLFVASMLVLVLADDFLVLLLGWEGVGLCSYLLIGFWYRENVNVIAARKAFIVTRIGDAAFLIGIFLLFLIFDTMRISTVIAEAPRMLKEGSALAVLTAVLLLGGAVGKSAQVPLQVWLPDAMAGPTPVSALIHAATMVTVGVYLIARTGALFILAPEVMRAVAVIGAVTLIMASASALVQRDIKRSLAYSTISQIGYMFLGLGVGAFTAAIFHFVVHAFFKSLLFLAAGAVISALDHEQDMFRMGGLRKSMPGTFTAFLAGAASMAALPVITAGFYSKDEIIYSALFSTAGGRLFFAAALTGAFLTALYSFRMVMLVFYGDRGERAPSRFPGWKTGVPLAVLSILSITTGALNPPSNTGVTPYATRFLEHLLPNISLPQGNAGAQLILQIISGAVAVIGSAGSVVFYAYVKKQQLLKLRENPVVAFLSDGWLFDRIYRLLFVKTYTVLSLLGRFDLLGKYGDLLAIFMRFAHAVSLKTQTGKIRWYAAGIVAGVIIIIAIGVL